MLQLKVMQQSLTPKYEFVILTAIRASPRDFPLGSLNLYHGTSTRFSDKAQGHRKVPIRIRGDGCGYLIEQASTSMEP